MGVEWRWGGLANREDSRKKVVVCKNIEKRRNIDHSFRSAVFPIARYNLGYYRHDIYCNP